MSIGASGRVRVEPEGGGVQCSTAQLSTSGESRSANGACQNREGSAGCDWLAGAGWLGWRRQAEGGKLILTTA